MFQASGAGFRVEGLGFRDLDLGFGDIRRQSTESFGRLQAIKESLRQNMLYLILLT